MKISIITATYNSQEHINQNICSVQEQTVNSEQIFIDNCSEDRTLSIIKSSMRRGDILISERDEGLYHAFNKGIQHASGDIIAILNSDDCYARPDALELVINEFQKGVDIVYSGTKYLRSEKQRHEKVYIPSLYRGRGSFARGWHPPHPSFFVRKQCYQCSGDYNTMYKVAADFELMMRFFEVEDYKSSLIPSVLVKMHPDGYSSTWKNRLQGYKDIRLSFEQHGIVPSPVYFLKRYGKKILDRYIQVRKIK